MSQRTPARREVLFKVVGILAGLAIVLSYRFVSRKHGSFPLRAVAEPTFPSGAMGIVNAFAAHKSGLMVQSVGTVIAVPDAAPASKQQKFLVTLDNRHTVLVTHDTDTAPAVPANIGDRLEFRGQYEWTDQGGLIHWTQHDPDMKHEDGWIKLGEKVYR